MDSKDAKQDRFWGLLEDLDTVMNSDEEDAYEDAYDTDVSMVVQDQDQDQDQADKDNAKAEHDNGMPAEMLRWMNDPKRSQADWKALETMVQAIGKDITRRTLVPGTLVEWEVKVGWRSKKGKALGIIQKLHKVQAAVWRVTNVMHPERMDDTPMQCNVVLKRLEPVKNAPRLPIPFHWTSDYAPHVQVVVLSGVHKGRSGYLVEVLDDDTRGVVQWTLPSRVDHNHHEERTSVKSFRRLRADDIEDAINDWLKSFPLKKNQTADHVPLAKSRALWNLVCTYLECSVCETLECPGDCKGLSRVLQGHRQMFGQATVDLLYSMRTPPVDSFSSSFDRVRE